MRAEIFILFFLPFIEGEACRSSSQRLPHTIAIFGGTGKLGNECVYQALKRDHKVLVLGRNKTKLVIPEGSGGELAGKPIQDSKLKFISGSVTDSNHVDQVFSDNDVNSVIIGLLLLLSRLTYLLTLSLNFFFKCWVVEQKL
jgi:hypothetical protein